MSRLSSNKRINRRVFLQRTAAAAAGFHALAHRTAYAQTPQRRAMKKMIVLGIDGMDPRLSESLMAAGRMPNFAKLRELGGFRRLATSIPPQSPVAWANFITGAGPGVHGIFDFIQRDPARQCAPYYGAADTIPGEGAWEVGGCRLPLTFWPFNHKAKQTVLKRRGTPFWDYLDAAGIAAHIYMVPSNYPPSPSRYGYQRSLAGLGTTDLLGSYSTYQHYAEDGPAEPLKEAGGIRMCLEFKNDSAPAVLFGPNNDYQAHVPPTAIRFDVYRDRQSRSALLEVQGRKILLKQGQWSDWVSVVFRLALPSFMPDDKIYGIVRFYLQEVGPNFRLYASPLNIDPARPVTKISEPPQFSRQIAADLGPFATLGFQEDYNVLFNRVFTDEEFKRQADYVLQQRIRMLNYALDHFAEGLLFFYFSSTDLQAHMFWWEGEGKHPVRTPAQARQTHEYIKQLYEKMDRVLGDVLARYADEAVVIVLSDHGFANFGRQFNVNTWLLKNGYLQPGYCTNILLNADWTQTRAYALGLNGLYLNLRGRERAGIVEPAQRDQLLEELTGQLLAVRDVDDRPVIRSVHRADQIHRGPALEAAPDLIVGYYRGYRGSNSSCLGGLESEIIADNPRTWSADHCIAAEEVPGVLFCNRPIAAEHPNLVDLAPTILAEFGLPSPPQMTGKSVFPAAAGAAGHV